MALSWGYWTWTYKLKNSKIIWNANIYLLGHGLGLWNGYQWQQQIHILEECCGYVDTVHDD